MTDADICDLVAATYDPGSTWDFQDSGANDDHVYWCVKVAPGALHIAFRGSVDNTDWQRDFLAVTANPAPFNHKSLGPVHAGFFVGIPDVWAELKGIVAKVALPVMFEGHSLGAAHAALCAALAVCDGISPAGLVLFGEPNEGFQQFAGALAAVPVRSYRNRREVPLPLHDPVTDVPFRLPLFPYVGSGSPRPRLDLATGTVDLDPFSLHHIALYQTTMRSEATAFDAALRSGGLG